jgi:hypothetical protein
MKRIKSSKPRQWIGVAATLLAGAIYAASLPLLSAADSKTDKAAKSEKAVRSAKETSKPAQKKKLSGGDLYAMHCGRCHPERYATEFTAAQWKTIMIEMRVRANLPADQAKAILKYLQEDSGTP